MNDEILTIEQVEQQLKTENPAIQEPPRFQGDPKATWVYWVATDPSIIPLDWVWERLRYRRNQLLSESDWTQVADSSADKVKWAAYRKALRDLPATTKDPRIPVWPVAVAP